MGNHEYNVVAYAKESGGGHFLRSHNASYTKQHQATLDQFARHPAEWQSYLDWFYTLPLFLDLALLLFAISSNNSFSACLPVTAVAIIYISPNVYKIMSFGGIKKTTQAL